MPSSECINFIRQFSFEIVGPMLETVHVWLLCMNVVCDLLNCMNSFTGRIDSVVTGMLNSRVSASV